MNRIEEQIIRAVAEERVNRGTVLLAKRYLERRERHAAEAAARSCTTEAVAKAAIASVEHHKKARRAEERELEQVGEETWRLVLERVVIDHRGHVCCEACARLATPGRELEPHHLELGAGGRRDAPEVVMALCCDCHRLAPSSAHRRPRWFVQNVVIPWLDRHGYPHPNRKEYRS